MLHLPFEKKNDPVVEGLKSWHLYSGIVSQHGFTWLPSVNEFQYSALRKLPFCYWNFRLIWAKINENCQNYYTIVFAQKFWNLCRNGQILKFLQFVSNVAEVSGHWAGVGSHGFRCVMLSWTEQHAEHFLETIMEKGDFRHQQQVLNLIVTWWCHMATKIWINIGSGNGLLPDGTKPLPEPMLTDHQWSPLSPVTFILITGQFYKRYLNHQSLKSVWKLHV